MKKIKFYIFQIHRECEYFYKIIQKTNRKGLYLNYNL